MNGKETYDAQTLFQEKLLDAKETLPKDNPQEYQRSITLIIEELGELLKVDKRWKTIRNGAFNRDEKLKEYADSYICMLNLAIHSGFSYEEIMKAVSDKIEINFERLEKEKGICVKSENHY
jgi:NTP pyrophosphatase (non-canonical NTP hydrolase)